MKRILVFFLTGLLAVTPCVPAYAAGYEEAPDLAEAEAGSVTDGELSVSETAGSDTENQVTAGDSAGRETEGAVSGRGDAGGGTFRRPMAHGSGGWRRLLYPLRG